MGVRQSKVIKFLVQDAEFDDIFANYLFNKVNNGDFIYYLVGDINKFSGDARLAKETLLEKLNMKSISNTPTLYTDGNGNAKDSDIKQFTNIVEKDLTPIVNTEGFNVEIILTGQCAPFIKIFTNLLENDYINPSDINIYLINGLHNGKGLFNELVSLNKVSSEMSIDLNIHEFNSFSSMGLGSSKWTGRQEIANCGTTNNFNSIIKDLANDGNCLAQTLINYAVLFNKSLINNTVEQIKHVIHLLNELCFDHDIKIISNNVESYINQLFNENGDLNIEICQKLSNDLRHVVSEIDNTLSITDDIDIKDRLYKSRGWFKVKADITSNNLLCFPLHDIVIILLYNNNPILKPYNAYGVSMGEFLDIRTSPINDKSYIELLHYVADDPNDVRNHIETMILDTIRLF